MKYLSRVFHKKKHEVAVRCAFMRKIFKKFEPLNFPKYSTMIDHVATARA